jgi:hypothetical protein
MKKFALLIFLVGFPKGREESEGRMIRKQNKLLPVIMLILASGLLSSAIAQRQEWRNIKGKSLVKFDWNCSIPADYFHTKLSRVVRATMKSKKFGGGRHVG